LDRIDRPFMIKNSQQNKRNLPQNNQAQVWKYPANKLVNGEKWKASRLRTSTRQGYLLLPLLLNIILEVLDTKTTQVKERKYIWVRKEVKFSLQITSKRLNHNSNNKITIGVNKQIQFLRYKIKLQKLMTVIPALGRLRQEDHKFEASWATQWDPV
jgi:hypothetical protein